MATSLESLDICIGHTEGQLSPVHVGRQLSAGATELTASLPTVASEVATLLLIGGTDV